MLDRRIWLKRGTYEQRAYFVNTAYRDNIDWETRRDVVIHRDGWYRWVVTRFARDRKYRLTSEIRPEVSSTLKDHATWMMNALDAHPMFNRRLVNGEYEWGSRLEWIDVHPGDKNWPTHP
jgi:hypothetical protein